jgi:hypothetical protein
MFLVYKRITSAVKRVEFVSDRISYIIARSGRCDIIVLDVHAPAQDKTDEGQLLRGTRTCIPYIP